MVPEKQLYSELRSLEPWPGKKSMEYGEGKKPKGRPRDKAWGMVDPHPINSKRWICRHCKNTYAGDVTRIKLHLACTGGGKIVPCPDVTAKIQRDAQELLQAQAATATARNDGKKNMGRPKNKSAWEMVVCHQDLKHWTCRYCALSSNGSVTRIKYHLAKMTGGGIAACPYVPGHVQKQALQLLQAQAAPARNDLSCLIDRPLLLGPGNIAVAQGGQLDNATFVGPMETGTGPHNPGAGQNHPVEEMGEMEWELLSEILLCELPNE